MCTDPTENVPPGVELKQRTEITRFISDRPDVWTERVIHIPEYECYQCG